MNNEAKEEIYKVFIVFELRERQTGDRRGRDVAFVPVPMQRASGYGFAAAHYWRGQTSSCRERSEAMEKDLCKNNYGEFTFVKWFIFWDF